MRIIKPAAAVIIFLAIMSLIGDFKAQMQKVMKKKYICMMAEKTCSVFTMTKEIL